MSLFRASCRIRTNDPEITNHVLWPTELKRQSLLIFESGRRGSNPRPPAWKASALSTELLPHLLIIKKVWAQMDSNHRRRKPADLQSAPFGHSGICPTHSLCDSYRIQTYNLLIRSQMLYSVELTSRIFNDLWALTDSNRRPSACKADALNQLS